MEEIKDDLGRGKKFDKVDADAILSALNSAVGKAAAFVSEKIKDSSAMDQVVKALSELGEDIKESLKSSESLVNEVKRAADAMSKAREAPPKRDNDFSKMQFEQTKILNSILASQRKAQSAKMATFTAGAGVGARSGSKSASLEDFGFKPKGTDRVPAMLSAGEYIVNKKGARDNKRTLDSINRGYYKGGTVKPAYLAAGSKPGTRPMEKPSLLGWAAKRTFGVSLDIGGAAEEKAGEVKKYDELGEKLAEHLNKGFKDKDRKEMARWLTGMSTMLLGGKSDLLGNLFSGAVNDATNFNREMRAIAFEMKGINGSTRDMQAQFADVGTSIKETGKSIDLVQKLYMSNLRKGFRTQKDGLKVIKSGLFLSTMIGSEASQTADMFADWNRTLGMSARQMDRLAHDTKEIARSTGVTGDELLAAMKSSEGILKNLRGQGNLTSGAAKNVITAMTEAKKLGVEEPAQRILGAMGGTNSLLEADNKTQAFVFKYAGRMGKEGNDAAIQGTLLKDKKLLKGFVSEMDTDIAQLTRGRARTVAEIENLTDEERTNLAIAIKASTGLDLYEFQSMHKVLEMSSKSLADKLNELGEEVKDATKTESEKKIAMQQMEDLQMSAGLGFISKLSEQANKKGSGSFAKEADKTMSGFKGDERADFDLILKSMDAGVKAQIEGLSGSQKDFAAMGLVTAKRLQEQGKAAGLAVEDFGPELLSAMSSGDKKRIGEISDEMTKAANKISVYSKADSDPMAKLAFQLSEMNENIRNFFAPLISGIIDLVGSNGLLMAQLGLASAAIYESFGKSILDKLGFARIFPKIGRTPSVTAPAPLPPARSGLGWSVPAVPAEQAATAASSEVKESFFKTFAKDMKSKIPKLLTKYFYRPIRNQLYKASIGIERLFGGIANLVEFGPSMSKITPILERIRRVIEGLKSASINAVMSVGHIFSRKSWGAGLGRILTFIKSIGPRISKAFEGTKIGDMALGIKNLFKGIPSLSSMRSALFGIFSFKGFANMIRGAGKILSTGLRGLAGTLTAGWANILFAVVDGAMGAYQGFNNAGKIFDGVIKKNTLGIKELTTGMKASAAVGGAIAGVIDGLLFGIPTLLGMRGTLEKFFSYVAYAFAIFGDGVSEGFKTWMPEISKSMTALGDAFLGLWNSIMDIFGMDPAADMADAFNHLYAILKPIGHALGWLVGGVLNSAINTITGFVWALTGLSRIVDGISDVVYYVAKMFYNLGAAVLHPVKTVQSMIEGIAGWFDWLRMYLYGNSVVPDMCEGIAMVFARMAINVVSGVASMVGKVAMFFLKLPFRIMGGLFNAFVKWPIKMMYKLINFMSGGLLSKGLEGMASLARSFFDSILRGATEALKMGYRLMNFLSGGWLDAIVSGLSKIGGKIVTLVDDYLTKPIVGAFTYIAEKIAGLLNKIPLPRWLMGGGNAAAASGAANGASKVAGAADDVAVAAAAATKPFSGMGGAMGAQAAKTATATASVADDATKLVLASADDIAKAAPKALGFFGKAGGLVSGLAKKAPILGPMLDFGIRKATGQSTGKAAVGAGGGLAGGMAGAAIGTMILPGIGTAIGAAIGGIAGGMLADKAYDSVVPEDGSKSLLEADNKMIAQGDMQLEHGEIMANTLAMGAQPGSMYVHDIHVEDLLYNIWHIMKKNGSSADAYSELERKMKESNERISMLDGTLSPMAERATKPGSIYTHDVHVEKELKDKIGEDKKDAASTASPASADAALKAAESSIEAMLKPEASKNLDQSMNQTYAGNMRGDLEGFFSSESERLVKAMAEATASGDTDGAKKLEEEFKKLGEQRKSVNESLEYVAASNDVMNQKQGRLYALEGDIAAAKATNDEAALKSLSEEKAATESAMKSLEAKKAEHVKNIEGKYGDKTVKSFGMQKGVTGFRMEGSSSEEHLKEFHDAKVRAGMEEKTWDMMSEKEKYDKHGIAGVETGKVDLQKHKRETYESFVPDEKVIPVEKWTPEMRNENMRRERAKMMQKESEMHSALTEEQSKALLKERADFSGSRPGGKPTDTGTWNDVTEVSDITMPQLKEAADLPYMETHNEAYAREGRDFAESQKRLQEMTAQKAASERKWYEFGSSRSDKAKASLPKDLDEQIKKEQLNSDLIAQRQRSGISIPSTKSPFEKDENGRIVESNELGLRRERKEMEESQAKLKELQAKKGALGPENKTWGDFFMWRGDERANKAKAAAPDLDKEIFNEELKSRGLKAMQGMGEPMRRKDWTGGDAYSPNEIDVGTMEAQGQTQIDKLSAVENMADHATTAGSIFTHDIHTEGLLESLLNGKMEKDAMPEAIARQATDVFGQMEGAAAKSISLGKEIVNKAVGDYDKLAFAEINPRRPEPTDAMAWKPIDIPAKDPAMMARFDEIQKEIMQSGLEVPLIPSSTSSLNITDAETGAGDAIQAGSMLHSTPVGQHAIPILKSEEDADVNGVQPVHLRDITDSILRDKVGASAGTNKVQSDELARMEKVANDQYVELQQIREGIYEMVALLRPSGTSIAGDSEMASAKTKNRRKGNQSSIYGKMKYGQPGGNANRAVINDGMC